MKLTGIVIGGAMIAAVAFSPYIVAAVDAVSNEAVSEQLAKLLDPEAYPDANPEVLKEWLSALPAGQVAILMFVLWYRNYLGPFVLGLLMLALGELYRARGMEPPSASPEPQRPTPNRTMRKSIDQLAADFAANPRRRI